MCTDVCGIEGGNEKMPNYFKNGYTPEERRRVLPGYPKDFVFKNYEEYKQYFVGDKIICLLCGKNYRSLGNHLRVSHETTIDDYKKKYGILWGKSLICNELTDIRSKLAKKTIADGKLIPQTLEGRRKLAELARKSKRKPRNLKLHKVSSQDNIKKYNDLHGFDGSVTKEKEKNRTKLGTPEFKKKMAERPQCNFFGEKYKYFWIGKKQTEEHKKKKSEAMKAYHKNLKEKKNERTT